MAKNVVAIRRATRKAELNETTATVAPFDFEAEAKAIIADAQALLASEDKLAKTSASIGQKLAYDVMQYHHALTMRQTNEPVATWLDVAAGISDPLKKTPAGEARAAFTTMVMLAFIGDKPKHGTMDKEANMAQRDARRTYDSHAQRIRRAVDAAARLHRLGYTADAFDKAAGFFAVPPTAFVGRNMSLGQFEKRELVHLDASFVAVFNSEEEPRDQTATLDTLESVRASHGSDADADKATASLNRVRQRRGRGAVRSKPDAATQATVAAATATTPVNGKPVVLNPAQQQATVAAYKMLPLEASMQATRDVLADIVAKHHADAEHVPSNVSNLLADIESLIHKVRAALAAAKAEAAKAAKVASK